MVNKKYRSGAIFERKIVNWARAEGLIAYRSAGSKSGEKAKIDVTIINPITKTIYLVQAKAKKKLSKNSKEKIEKDILMDTDEYIIKSLAIDKTNFKEFIKKYDEEKKLHNENQEAIHELFEKNEKKELTKTEEKNLEYIRSIRKLLNYIDNGKYLNNQHIKEMWRMIDLLERDILREY